MSRNDDRDRDRDRPKKSWRELDQMRDNSSHRRDEPSGGARAERLQRSAAYRGYKTQLNKLFDGKGDVPEGIKAKLEAADVASGAKQRRGAAEAILSAQHPQEIRAALQAYQQAYGFPDQEDVLAHLLGLSDEEIVLPTLTAIERLRDDNRLKRGVSLKARIKTAQMLVDDPDVQDVAARVLKKL